MKRIVLVVAFSLAACEGEPPKVPVSAGPAVAAEAPAASPPPEPATPSAPVAAAGTCCNCCPTGDAAAAAPPDASATAPDGSAPGPTAVLKANVTGTVTTTPAAQAANAVVYLADAPVEPTAKMSATVDNRQMTFAPYIAVVPVGGRVTFHNSDPFPHNVFSPDNEKWNLGTIVQGAAVARTFKKAGSYTLLCNLHPGMIGYLVVSPSSYYAKADAKGRYTIKDVPAGTYNVVAWAPRLQGTPQAVTVKDGDVKLDFELHR